MGTGQGTQTSGTQIREDEDGPKLARHRHRLVVLAGPDRGLEREVGGTRITIGTAEDNSVVLTDPTVSRRHCEIAMEQGRHVLRDLGSTNRTRLNGLEVTEAVLPVRARIRLGDTELRLQSRRKWERVEPSERTAFGEMVGRSEAMRTVFSMLQRVAASDLTCVVTGETGTGKELAARALHHASPRADGPFVVLDCAAVSETLIAAELFGHEKGAYTGADRARPGVFERADGGTLLLDELGELPKELQPKLLRVLQQREVRRIGADRAVEVDVRVVAATHRDLAALVEAGEFREDLYYRLAEVVVRIPALRERPDDIAPIAEYVLEEQGARTGQALSLDSTAREMLSAYDWSGNVRELRNVLRRAAALTTRQTLAADDFEPLMRHGGGPSAPGTEEPEKPEVNPDVTLREAREQWLAPLEREYLMELVKRFDGDLDQAARQAGIHRKSFERLLRHYGFKPSELKGRH